MGIIGVIAQKDDGKVSETAQAQSFANWLMLAVTGALIAFVIVTGNQGENTLYSAWQSRDGFWCRLQWALQRPLLDLAAACLLWLCVSGRTPRLASFFGAKV